MRADVYLIEKGFATSRARAQELIEGGRVSVVRNGVRQLVKKASAPIDPSVDQLEVSVDPTAPDYVSRGGLKMRGALERTRYSPSGKTVLDVGISTGGFTDCLLQAGAERVVGVDVGHGQLAEKLQSDSRVKHLEGINARHLADPPINEQILGLNAGRKFDLIVIDVSFISLTLVLPGVIHYLLDSAFLLALVKPQFEVGRDGLNKNGIVKDPARYAAVEESIRRAAHELGLIVEDYFESSIEGSDGNREFFIFARKP